MTKVTKPKNGANEQKKTKKIHKIWSNPIISNLIDNTSGRADILIEDKLRILNQEEIDALENTFIKMVLDFKAKMIDLIDRKLNKLDIDSPIMKRVDEFIFGVINNVPRYELDYTIRDILMQLPIIKGKKYGDFPVPHSAIEMFQDSIKDLEAMPDLMKNANEERPKLKENIKYLESQIVKKLRNKFDGVKELLDWYNPIRESYYKKIDEKYPDSGKYFAWHALIGSTTMEGVSIYVDFPGEDSVNLFLETTLKQIEVMPDILKNPEENRETLYGEVSLKRKIIIDIATEKLGITNARIWWQIMKFEKYCKEIQTKYGESALDYFAWHGVIGSTPWKGGPHKYVDIIGEDSVINFLDGCIVELENMTQEDVEIVDKKVNIFHKIRQPNYSENEVKELEDLFPKMPHFNAGEMIELYKKIATLRDNLGEISREFLGDLGGLYRWNKKTSQYFTRIQKKYPNLSEYIVWPYIIGATPTEGEAKIADDLPEPDSVMTFFDDCKNELMNMPKGQLKYYNGFTVEILRSLRNL